MSYRHNFLVLNLFQIILLFMTQSKEYYLSVIAIRIYLNGRTEICE